MRSPSLGSHSCLEKNWNCALGLLASVKTACNVKGACCFKATIDNDLKNWIESTSMCNTKKEIIALEMKWTRPQLTSWGRCASCRILHDPICYAHLTEVAYLPSMRFYIQDYHWTGSFLDSSPYDLLSLHGFLRGYLVDFKVSNWGWGDGPSTWIDTYN